jgi:nitrite reductase/ring-hydroxylating ferredoxin subunit
VTVGPPDDATVVGLMTALAASRPIVLTSLDGTWFAFEDRCSHAGCAFSEDGELDGTTVICGCHGSEFDIRTGEVLRQPAERPIAVFPTRVVDGTVEVEVP